MAMMRYRMKHAETLEETVHYEGPFTDFSLCGDALECDRYAAESVPTVTTKRVTCERCMAVVRHVRGR